MDKNNIFIQEIASVFGPLFLPQLLQSIGFHYR